MDKRLLFSDEDGYLTDKNNSRWSFGDPWNNCPAIRQINLNGSMYKVTGGIHRGFVMYLDDSHTLHILHGYKEGTKNYKDLFSPSPEKYHVCKMGDPDDDGKWNKGWSCIWEHVNEWVCQMVRVRFGLRETE